LLNPKLGMSRQNMNQDNLGTLGVQSPSHAWASWEFLSVSTLCSAPQRSVNYLYKRLDSGVIFSVPLLGECCVSVTTIQELCCLCQFHCLHFFIHRYWVHTAYFCGHGIENKSLSTMISLIQPP